MRASKNFWKISVSLQKTCAVKTLILSFTFLHPSIKNFTPWKKVFHGRNLAFCPENAPKNVGQFWVKFWEIFPKGQMGACTVTFIFAILTQIANFENIFWNFLPQKCAKKCHFHPILGPQNLRFLGPKSKIWFLGQKSSDFWPKIRFFKVKMCKKVDFWGQKQAFFTNF